MSSRELPNVDAFSSFVQHDLLVDFITCYRFLLDMIRLCLDFVGDYIVNPRWLIHSFGESSLSMLRWQREITEGYLLLRLVHFH